MCIRIYCNNLTCGSTPISFSNPGKKLKYRDTSFCCWWKQLVATWISMYSTSWSLFLLGQKAPGRDIGWSVIFDCYEKKARGPFLTNCNVVFRAAGNCWFHNSIFAEKNTQQHDLPPQYFQSLSHCGECRLKNLCDWKLVLKLRVYFLKWFKIQKQEPDLQYRFLPPWLQFTLQASY